MTSTAGPTTAASPVQTARIIWVAILASHVTFAAVAWVLRAQGVDLEWDRIVLLVLSLGGAIAAVFGPVVERGLLAAAAARLRASGETRDDAALARAQLQPMIVRFAFADLGALASMLVLLAGGPELWWAGGALLAFIVVAGAMPSAGKVSLWKAELAGRR